MARSQRNPVESTHQIHDVEKSHISSEVGSCSTVVWKMLLREKYDFSEDLELQTALYYGLYTDTGQFMDILNPVDKDMRDGLSFINSIIKRLQNSNINAKELEIAGVAIIRSVINEELHFAVVRSQPCDPNILGLISDFVLQVSEVDKCIVYCDLPGGIKYSVRSCVKEDQANHIAAYVSEDIGSGGGHVNKAGGFIEKRKYKDYYGDYDLNTYFSKKIKEYIQSFDIIESANYEYDIEDASIYEKRRVRVGYVRASSVVPKGCIALIRTLEGDINLDISEDIYIMIGVKGEVYPISGEKFNKNYEPVENEEYDIELEYHPKIKIRGKSEEYSLIDHVKVCYAKTENLIYAKQLERPVKLFTRWDEERYIIGNSGDYLAVKCDDMHDVYVIDQEAFYMTYDEHER